MTLKECYEEMEGDFEDVTSRLRTNERIQKFLLKVLDDKSFDLLLKSIEAEDWEEAFRAAHTLKGVCQNLAITRLYKSVSPLSDSLREGKRDSELLPMLKQVEKDYEHITKCIKSYRRDDSRKTRQWEAASLCNAQYDYSYRKHGQRQCGRIFRRGTRNGRNFRECKAFGRYSYRYVCDM